MFNDLEITFLSEEELKECKTIDFVTAESNFASIINDQDYYGWDCTYWLKDNFCSSQYLTAFNTDVELVNNEPYITIRPVLKYSLIKPYVEEEYRYNKYLSVNFGEYPQNCVHSETYLEYLENSFQNGKMIATGKMYTTDSPFYDKNGNVLDHRSFKPYEHVEYEFKGKRYIRVTDFFPHFSTVPYIESKNDKVIWVEVEPISWDIDEEHDIAITHYAILSGIKYEYDDDYYKPNIYFNHQNFVLPFQETSIYKYLNEYLVKDIIPQTVISKNNLLKEIDYNKNDYNSMISRKFN